MYLHRFAQLVAFSTFLLICAGGLVTSTDSGLSVPDWPTTYGYNMFTFPLSKMVGGILYEHTHRLIASTVGLLTIVLAVWLTLKEERKWLVILGWIALAAVIAQGILGGLTVRYFLPALISVSHAGLAKIFFCIAIAIAFFTGKRGGSEMDAEENGRAPRYEFLKKLALLLTGVVYLQILIGAVMRHTYDPNVGFAIPDFPLSHGRLLPEFDSFVVTVHFLHRILGILVAVFIFGCALYALRNFRDNRLVLRPLLALCFLVLLQISLGALTIWTQRGGPDFVYYEPVPLITTLHQANGALILGISFLLCLRSFHLRGHPINEGATPKSLVEKKDYALQV